VVRWFSGSGCNLGNRRDRFPPQRQGPAQDANPASPRNPFSREDGSPGSPMIICKSCGRKIEASEVKYRTTENGVSVTICPDCAKQRGI
jgi:hypothetical protein